MRYPLCFTVISALCLKVVALESPPANLTKEPNDHVENNVDRCECYIVSGPEPGYFQNYMFYDFRSVSPEKTWSPDNTAHGTPRNRTVNPNREFRVNLEETGFLDDWVIQDWSRNSSKLFPIPIANDYDNVFVVENTTNSTTDTTYLALRTTRLDNHTSTAEIETYSSDFFRCSFRVRLRLHDGENGRLEDVDGDEDEWDEEDGEEGPDFGAGKPAHKGRNHTNLVPSNHRERPPPNGAVAGIFTFHSVHVESDIEILTSDPNTLVHYANQPDWDPLTDEEIPGSATTTDVPVPWTEWANHRLDWFPNMTRWYLDNQFQDEKSYRVPDKPSMLVLNLWSDGGEWSGNMSVGSAVYMGVEWIEVAYNTSSDVTELSDVTDQSRPSHQRQSARRHRKHMMENRVREKRKNKQRAKGKDRQKVDDDNDEWKCQVACRIDDVATIGSPEVVWDFSVPKQ
ncbi:hypothetical protein FQN51_001142 [Onygenales sp. PD_10]|nr:hypothetical protein FQN51_001142 [Onygenales sp. PD_10]